MDVQIISDKKESYSNLQRTYHYSEMQCGKHKMTRAIAYDSEGKLVYVRVIVANSSHRAWRGMGKQFSSIELAMANYKTPEIRAMINA